MRRARAGHRRAPANHGHEGVISAIEPADASSARDRAGVRRPARAPAHAWPRGRGDDPLRHRGRSGRRVLRDPRDAEHRACRRLGVRARRARRAGAARRVIPTGFMAAISKGQRRRRAHRDGRARRRPEPPRSRTTVVPWSPRGSCGERSSTARSPIFRSRSTARSRRSRAAGMRTRGRCRAELGLGGYPSIAESVMVERDLSLAGAEERPLHLMHLSARESVAALDRALASGVAATGEVTPHHLVPHRRGRPLARSEHEDESAAAIGARTARRSATRSATARSRASPPITRRTRGTRRRCRSRRRRSASPGWRRPSRRSTHTSSRPASSPRDDSSSACPPAPRVRSDSPSPESRSARERISSRSTSMPSGQWPRRASARARRTRGCSARQLRGRVVKTVADGRVVFERMSSGYLVLEDGTVFRGRSVAADGRRLRRGRVHDRR